MDVGGGGGGGGAASRGSQTIYTTSWALLKLICGWATPGLTANKLIKPRPPDVTHVRDESYQTFRVFHRPSASVYLSTETEEQKKRGRPGNEANILGLHHIHILQAIKYWQ